MIWIVGVLILLLLLYIFRPHGHYFVSAGHDRTVRLWSSDHYQPLRVFAGHLSDVDVSMRQKDYAY